MPRMVDRSIARAIAVKRIVTGSVCLALGVGMIVVVAMHGGPPPGQAALAVLIFWGGGAWALRDGLRLRKMLREAPPSSSSSSSSS